MTNTAWLFPGQGSQAVGMEADLTEMPAAKAQFDRAEAVLGWSIIDRCRGDEAELSQTQYTQPCLYVVEAILADLALARGEKPQLVAGHSLGEYVALYAARVFDFETGLALVKQRAELMAAAEGGKMVALMKFDRDTLQTVVEATPDVVIANDNSEMQVVISGTPEAVDTVISQVKAKRAAPLKVSGAFHSPFMADAATRFQDVLDAIEFANADVPVLSNVAPEPTVDGAMLKERLLQQMTGSVRWRETILRLPQEGIEAAIEVGPGNVLSGLLKRICPDIPCQNARSAAEWNAIFDAKA